MTDDNNNNKKTEPINRQSPIGRYLKDRKKINLVGSLRGAPPAFELCSEDNIGRLSYSQHDEKGDVYLLCNNFPLCKNKVKSKPKPDTAAGPTDIEFTHPQDGASGAVGDKDPLICYSFGGRGKNRSNNKKIIDDDDWTSTVFGSGARLVEESTSVYNSDQGWERRE